MGYIVMFGQHVKQYLGWHAPTYFRVEARVIRTKKDATKLAEQYLNGEVVHYDKAPRVLNGRC